MSNHRATVKELMRRDAALSAGLDPNKVADEISAALDYHDWLTLQRLRELTDRVDHIDAVECTWRVDVMPETQGGRIFSVTMHGTRKSVEQRAAILNPNFVATPVAGTATSNCPRSFGRNWQC